MAPAAVKMAERDTVELDNTVVGRRHAAVSGVAVHGATIHHKLTSPVACAISGTSPARARLIDPRSWVTVAAPNGVIWVVSRLRKTNTGATTNPHTD